MKVVFIIFNGLDRFTEESGERLNFVYEIKLSIIVSALTLHIRQDCQSGNHKVTTRMSYSIWLVSLRGRFQDNHHILQHNQQDHTDFTLMSSPIAFSLMTAVGNQGLMKFHVVTKLVGQERTLDAES